MMKTKRTAGDEIKTAVPTLEQFRMDVLEVFLFHVRAIAFMTADDKGEAKAAWALTGAPQLRDAVDLFSPDREAADLGLTYDHIRSSKLAKVLESLYQFGYLGRLDTSLPDPMESGTIYSWITSLVADAARGSVHDEWDGFGGDRGGAERCYLATEIANARSVLEGNEPFHFFGRPDKDKDDSVAYGALTVRQLALLAGMEEMSIRAAANPKRTTPLKTYNDQGRTRIALDVAKSWLESKGRYLPIVQVNSTAAVDLTKQRFGSIHAFRNMVDEQYERLLSDEKTATRAANKLKAAGLIWKHGQVWRPGSPDLEPDFADEGTASALANVLDLPADLLILRAREAIATEHLARTQRQLEEALRSRPTNQLATKEGGPR